VQGRETEITLNTIDRSFRKAHAQMPSDTPGIIFVKSSALLVEGRKIRCRYGRNWRWNIFAKTGKLSRSSITPIPSVMEKAWHGDTTGEIIAYQEHSNPNHRFDGLRDKGWQIFPDDPAIAPPERRSFNRQCPRVGDAPFFADVFDCANAP